MVSPFSYLGWDTLSPVAGAAFCSAGSEPASGGTGWAAGCSTCAGAGVDGADGVVVPDALSAGCAGVSTFGGAACGVAAVFWVAAGAVAAVSVVGVDADAGACCGVAGVACAAVLPESCCCCAGMVDVAAGAASG